ncbi:MAG: pyridoxamine 5'-phosphate oxidase family protein [Planctomyces sp.]|nr:pyridoxamine 5'-phosphate oxidase family protein [Planctomyces sp.]
MDVFDDVSQLNRIERDCWQHLQSAVTDRDNGWRLPVLATIVQNSVQQRTVVLRGVDELSQVLYFHTDIRSPKVGQLSNNRSISLAFYDHSLSVQLRVQGVANVHTDDVIADAIWSAGEPENLRMYLAPHPPGTISELSTSNLPPEFIGRIPERRDLEAGRSNFCVISVQVLSMDWLLLNRGGHVRAIFGYDQDDETHRKWLCP